MRVDDLPPKWCMSFIADVTEPVFKVQPANRPNHTFRYLDIAGIDNVTHRITQVKTYDGANAPSRARQLVKHGDILFSTVRTYLKNIAVVPHELDGEIASTGFSVLRPSTAIISEYIFAYTLTPMFLEPLALLQRGSSYPAVRDDDVRAQKIPLPPLAEQKRIVAKFEELFSELDAGEESLRQARRQLTTYRQALLKQAFAGKLTEKWREEQAPHPPNQIRPTSPIPSAPSRDLPKLPETVSKWKQASLADLGKWQGGGTPSKSNAAFWENGTIPWVSPKDMKARRIESAQDKITERALNGSVCKIIEPFSLLLVTRSGILAHSLPVGINTTRVTVNQDIKAITLNDECNADFLWYFFRAHENAILNACRKGGTTVHSIEFPALKQFIVPLPPLPEQLEIVRTLDEQFAAIEQTERELNQALAQSAALRQSILRHAFTGQLVPQDPNDEPASELLARIRTERKK